MPNTKTNFLKSLDSVVLIVTIVVEKNLSYFMPLIILLESGQ